MTLKALRNLRLLQDDLLAFIVESELDADIALLAMTQDVVKPEVVVRSGRYRFCVLGNGTANRSL